MAFRWIKLETAKGDLEKWVLVHKDTRVVVAELRMSPYGSSRDCYKMRCKLQMQYEQYYWKTQAENNMRFF